MYAGGTLASSDVSKMAEVLVREAMNKTRRGRYVYFDHVIDSEEEVVKLTTQMGIPANRITMIPGHGFCYLIEWSCKSAPQSTCKLEV